MKRTIIIAALLLAGCATSQGPGEFESSLNAWVGSPVDDLIDVLGAPDGQRERADGTETIMYSREVSRSTGLWNDYVYRCDLMVRVDGGEIVAVDYHGQSNNVTSGPDRDCRIVYGERL